MQKVTYYSEYATRERMRLYLYYSLREAFFAIPQNTAIDTAF